MTNVLIYKMCIVNGKHRRGIGKYFQLWSKRRNKTINGNDLVTELTTYEKVSEEVDDQLKDWQDKTPLGKALQASFNTDDDDGGDKKKKKK